VVTTAGDSERAVRADRELGRLPPLGCVCRRRARGGSIPALSFFLSGEVMSKIMRPVNLKLLAASSLMLLLPIGPHAQERRLSEAEAIRLAEQFVARNGYTDLPPDKGGLAHESVEWESDVDEILKARRDTLGREAFGLVRRRKGAPGWTIVFRYKHPATRQMRRNGRAVTMGLDGSGVRVEHADFILKYVDKRL
jgi:hypothetical protein